MLKRRVPYHFEKMSNPRNNALPIQQQKHLQHRDNPKSPTIELPLFPTLAVGLLDFQVDVVLARLEADFRDKPPSIPAAPNRRVSLQCPTAGYPYTAQLQSIPAMLNPQVSLQCPTTKYPCGAQPPSIPAAPNHQISLQCPTAEQRICSAFAVLQGRQLTGGRETLYTLLVQ